MADSPLALSTGQQEGNRGAAAGVRTPDLRFTRAALYQLSYCGKVLCGRSRVRTCDLLGVNEALYH